MAATDSTLVDRLRSGDRAAFRDLYGAFAQPSFRFLLRLAGLRATAEDLHQETWMRIARAHRELRADTDLQAWIFTIARNTFLSAQRRADPARPTVSGVAPEPPTASRPWDVDVDPTCRDLEMALRALPEAHREVLLLVGVEGLSIEQATSVLGLRADAVRQRLARARAALAETWARVEAGPPEIARMTMRAKGRA